MNILSAFLHEGIPTLRNNVMETLEAFLHFRIMLWKPWKHSYASESHYGNPRNISKLQNHAMETLEAFLRFRMMLWKP